ncbi:protoporphyrinogen oxidase HemJ [Litorivicinus lipolyticus]|uniref:Protoporphyrinogen IX oxidase n=1 Tax=Litorivicinus lipolyticus TaxID=418701 RepID=A0A5Q2QGC9_9GAMM|nr:protoporphyrinogen oxidase HemJ [Litorivicinus lipolyticus]QGG81086.1 protoporphyrinogen oxidase HemJ [Litorivicinus lipolyticus]
MTYLTIKALHLIAIVTWFAALFYLPRLFVYHRSADDSISRERFCIMERRLLKGIMTPSMIAVWILGITLISMNPGVASSGWLHVKLVLVLILSGYHGLCGKHVKAFARDENPKTETYFRWFNEFPVVILIAVVFLAILKPF